MLVEGLLTETEAVVLRSLSGAGTSPHRERFGRLLTVPGSPGLEYPDPCGLNVSVVNGLETALQFLSERVNRLGWRH